MPGPGANLLAAAVTGLLIAGSASAPSLLEPDNASMIARGAIVYEAHCAACHGADLEGQPGCRSPNADGCMPAPPHNENGHTWHHPDRILFDITKLGIVKAAGLTNYTSDMPVYSNILTDDEIIAVLSWIKAQWPDNIRKLHDDMNARYAAEMKQ